MSTCTAEAKTQSTARHPDDLRHDALRTPIEKLHILLYEMHRSYAVDPGAFREVYKSKTEEALSLIDVSTFAGYAVGHSVGCQTTVLHFAAGSGCMEVCAAILQRCSRLNFVVDAAGQTPLFWATQSGFCATTQLLLRFSADVVHTDIQGQSPLHVAAASGFIRTCGALIAAVACRGSDSQQHVLNLCTSRGLSALHLASRHGHTEVVMQLLEAKADACSETIQGRVPLHLAAMAGHAVAVDCLLAAEPKAHQMEDTEGMRAIDYAHERGWEPIIQTLSCEAKEQEKMRSKWRSQFEPRCRSLLNVAACEAFLEIGTPQLISVEHQLLRFTCRVIDALSLLEGYLVEVEVGGMIPALIDFVRRKEQKASDLVEFRVPRYWDGMSVWEIGTAFRLRVIGTLVVELATKAGLGCTAVYSTWTQCALRGR